jgi:hypothetical protein
MPKEWMEPKVAFEARIAELEAEIKTIQAGVGRKGVYILDEPPPKIVLPGQNPPNGLKITFSGINPHQAMHALIQGIAYAHQQIMMLEAQMQAQLQAKPSLNDIRLVQ